MSTRTLATHPLIIVAAGLLAGVVGVAAMSASPKWAVLLAVALLGAMPLLVVRPVEYYLLPIYFVLITVEVFGMSIERYFIDGGLLLRLHGIPPSGEVGLLVYPSDAVMLTMVALWLIPVMSGRRTIDVHQFGKLFALFLGWIAIVSLLMSEVAFLSIAEMIRQVKFFVIFLFAANFMRSRHFLRWFMYIGLLCLFIQSTVTTVAFFSGYTGHPMSFLLGGADSRVSGYEIVTPIDESDSSGIRAGGTFGNPVQTAIYLEFFIPLAFVMFWMEKQRWLRLLAGALFAFGCVAFWATLSRAGLISLVVAMGIGVLVLFVRKDLGLKTMLLIACTGLLVAGPIANKFIDYLSNRPTSIEGRFVIVHNTAIMIIENPIFGVGLNNHTVARRQRFRPDNHYLGEEIYPVHNHYLVMWSEAGLIGLVLQLAMFYLALKHAWILSRSGDRLVRMFATAAFISFIAIYMNLVADHFSGNAQRSLFFFFAGTVMAMNALIRREGGGDGDALRVHAGGSSR